MDEEEDAPYEPSPQGKRERTDDYVFSSPMPRRSSKRERRAGGSSSGATPQALMSPMSFIATLSPIATPGQEGSPHFWAQFRDWDLSPKTPDRLFEYTPPEGAERLALRMAIEEIREDVEGQ